MSANETTFSDFDDEIVGAAKLGKRKGVNITILGTGGGGSNITCAAQKTHYNAVTSSANAIQTSDNSSDNNTIKFGICNTDMQALRNSEHDKKHKLTKILLGPEFARGLGAGGMPEKGKRAAEESKQALQDFIKDSDIIVIVAGMGGGTGTGSVAIISQIAKEMGILTIVICSTPFKFEGDLRAKRADEGIQTFKKYTDSYIVISNEDLLHNIENSGNLRQTFAIADSVLSNVLNLYVSILFNASIINIDLADVINCMKDQGETFVGIGNSHKKENYMSNNKNKIADLSFNDEDQNSCERAAMQALSHPLLKEQYLQNASNLIMHILVNEKTKFEHIIGCVELIKKQINNSNINVVFGAGIKPGNSEEVEVLIIATGINSGATQEKIIHNNPLNTNANTINNNTINAQQSQSNNYTNSSSQPQNTANTAGENYQSANQNQTEQYSEEENIPAFFRRKSFMLNKNDLNKFRK